MDFTLQTYKTLLEALISQGYPFQPFTEYLEAPASRAIILRHDVEARYGNALAFARIQHEHGIRGTYYFRLLPKHFDKEIIREIASMGHEIGYHYDDLSYCKGDYEKAIRRFSENLATLREIAEVKTICMEGAPLSRYDNRDLWGKHQIPNSKFQIPNSKQIQNTKYKIQNSRNPNPESRTPNHYRDFGIIGEPYFDLDFSRVLYLTDTGRRWDGKGSVRDRVSSQRSAVSDENSKFQIPNSKQTQNSKFKTQNLNFRSTIDIIKAAEASLLPDQIMFTFHPQRWNDRPLPWIQELVMQNVKNVVKRWIVRSE